VLAELLTKNKSIISLENHGCLFLDSMSSSEKSGMLDLYGGYAFNGVVKTNREYIKDPILNICLASGPTFIVRELEKEKRDEMQSLSHVASLSPFMFVAPMPSFTRRREFFLQNESMRPFSVPSVLYFVHEINKLEMCLTLDELAKREYFEFYKRTRSIAKLASQWHKFLL
jgi:hypothetical protein